MGKEDVTFKYTATEKHSWKYSLKKALWDLIHSKHGAEVHEMVQAPEAARTESVTHKTDQFLHPSLFFLYHPREINGYWHQQHHQQGMMPSCTYLE